MAANIKWLKIFHLIVFLIYMYALNFYETLAEIRRQLSAGDNRAWFGNFKYLTYWNIVAQALVFTVATIVDFIPLSTNYQAKLHNFRNLLVTGIAVPYAFTVCLSFWSIYTIDRELIFPKAFEKYYPQWLNHLSHTLMLPLILIEISTKNYVWKRWQALQASLVFGGTYLIWVFFMGFVYNIWVYPILYQMSNLYRFIFLTFMAIVSIAQYFAVEYLNTFIWGRKKFSNTTSRRR